MRSGGGGGGPGAGGFGGEVDPNEIFRAFFGGANMADIFGGEMGGGSGIRFTMGGGPGERNNYWLIDIL
jgi:DnaJ homolog subfamily B member 12